MSTIPLDASLGLLDEGLFDVPLIGMCVALQLYTYTATPCPWARFHIWKCSRKLKLAPFSNDSRNNTYRSYMFGALTYLSDDAHDSPMRVVFMSHCTEMDLKAQDGQMTVQLLSE